MNRNQILSRDEFVALVREQDFHIQGPMTVRHDIILTKEDFVSKDDKLKSLHLENITFTGMVSMRGANDKPILSLSFETCNFLGGLMIEHFTGSTVSINSCEARYAHLYWCKFESAYMGNLTIEKSLDLSGLTLTTGLKINDVQCDDLELVHSTGLDMVANIARVTTDDLLIATQFTLAGVPVYMSRKAIREARLVTTARSVDGS